MWRNHLKIAWRNLKKSKLYTAINIFGLSSGLLAFLFILLYVQDELSYDKYNPFADQLYRVDFYGRLGDQEINSAQNAPPLAPTLQEIYPEVEAFVRFRSRGSYLVKYKNRHHKEDRIAFVDSTFFTLFGIPLIQGQAEEVLKAPNTVVITEAMGKKYFGIEDPMGKQLVLDNDESYEVTGVMEEFPHNTHFQYDFLLSLSTLEESRNQLWGSFNFNVYLLLQEGADVNAFETKIQDVLVDNFGKEVEKYVGVTWEEFLGAGNYGKYVLTPVHRIHLYSDLEDELEANSDIAYVWIFSIIGLFILFIACINFMNLATASASTRAKEVGVRKVVGAARGALVQQFLSESLLISLLSGVIALAGVWLLLPYFNELAGKDLPDLLLKNFGFVAVAATVSIVVGILAGSYPAFFLSAYQPIKVLKGQVERGQRKSVLRSGLIVFQFLITTSLIIGALVVYRQLHFVQNKKLGFDKEQVLVLNDAYALGDNVQAFKERILQNPAVEQATVTGFLPVPSYRNSTSYFKGNSATQENTILLNNWYVDHEYFETFDMEIADGRAFSRDFPSDSLSVILNEKATEFWQGEDPIGKYITEYDDSDQLVSYKIIGVVENFHYESLRNRIQPLALFLGRSNGAISMRLRTDDVAGFIGFLQKTWDDMAPGQPFAYNFLDDRFDQMYRAEQRIGRIISSFTILAIFIACIGLFGLATFAAQQRTKEIGIRKVLGASLTRLVGMLTKDFLSLVGVSLLIAIPLAWLGMRKWLENFAYSTPLDWWIFALAGVVALLIAFLTVSFQSIRAALANPVNSLRNE